MVDVGEESKKKDGRSVPDFWRVCQAWWAYPQSVAQIREPNLDPPEEEISRQNCKAVLEINSS